MVLLFMYLNAASNIGRFFRYEDKELDSNIREILSLSALTKARTKPVKLNIESLKNILRNYLEMIKRF